VLCEKRLLVIRTKIRASDIHGVGCFSVDAVKAGTVVWRLHPAVDLAFSAAQIRAMPEAFQIFLSQYASKDFGQDRYVLCSDNARFINHAVLPNLTHNKPVSADSIFANRDIAAGEELTLNYQFVDDPAETGNVLTEIGLTFGGEDELDPRLQP
jgi:SET domain-containing protein